MQIGEYITDRLMVGFIRDICAEKGIGFSSYSNDWILELTSGGRTRRVIGYKFSLNDAVSSGISGDKVAAHLTLRRVGIPSVQHVLLRVRDVPVQRELMAGWPGIVVKPLDGSGGHDVRLFRDIDAVLEHVSDSEINAWAASPLKDIEREIRLVLLDQKPLIVYEKQPVKMGGLKMFNLGLGATPRDITPDDELLDMAVWAQQALGLRLSAVDIIETTDGKREVLEVNSGFMMEHYARHSPSYKEKTIEAYRAIIDAVMSS